MKKEKIFLLTGASSELGMQLIQELNSQYSDSIFICHYHSSKEQLERMTFSNGNTMRLVRADLSSAEETAAMINEIEEQGLIPTHIVHMPATRLRYTKLKQVDTDRITTDTRIQVYSLIELLKAFLPAMVKRKEHNKVVAVISSVVNGAPPKQMMEYTLVKSMLLGLIRQLAADYTGKLVNINAVSPSMIETKFLADIDPRIVELSAEGSPEKRNAAVTDIVPALLFLLSEESNYITGVNLNVSNGNVIV